MDSRSALFETACGHGAEEPADFLIRVRYAASPVPTGRLLYENVFFRLFADGDFFLQQTLDRATLERGEKRAMLSARFCGGEGTGQRSIEVFLPPDFPREQECMQQLWQSINLPFQLMQKGIFTLHSAVVQTQQGAILFCGRSGIGKSTQANLWKDCENAFILNGDRCAVGFIDGAANAFGLPFCGTSGICSDFSAPIAAIVSLGQAPENTIARLSGVRALRALMNNVVGLCGNAMHKSYTETLLRAAECIPIFELRCTADSRAVRLLKETLIQ